MGRKRSHKDDLSEHTNEHRSGRTRKLAVADGIAWGMWHNQCRAALDDVRSAIEFRRVPARPQGVERNTCSIRRDAGNRLRHDHERATHPGKARALGEAA